MDRRVVITGIGAVTPLAAGAEESWNKLIEGKSVEKNRTVPANRIAIVPSKRTETKPVAVKKTFSHHNTAPEDLIPFDDSDFKDF